MNIYRFVYPGMVYGIFKLLFWHLYALDWIWLDRYDCTDVLSRTFGRLSRQHSLLYAALT
jgi:hypothetical protein